jgi:hypothetical protein
MNLDIEIFEKLAARILHRNGNVVIHFLAQALERCFDFFGGTAVLIDRDDALLEFDA